MEPQIPSRQHGKTPKTRRARLTSKVTAEQLDAIRQELKLLPNLIKLHYKKWTAGPQEFQLRCMEAQKLGKDVLLHASTGAGKTGIAAGPHLLPSSKGKVTLVVSPLLSLHQEQVVTFQEEFGLKATAINSANGGCTKSVMQSVIAGEWQIVILSPEMLLSRRFIDGVLRKPEFGARCLSVFIDEAHCISHWGDSFRKKYASIGIVRAFLPRATPIIAVTATLTPRVHQDLVTKLQFNPNDYIFCTIGNDRPNVSQVVRALEHPANSYRDLDFVVPDTNTRPIDTKKAFVYTDDIKDGGKIIDYLNARVNPTYRSRGLVRPYNAAMSPQYRAEVMSLFKAGIGCDIPDIELVVQWKIPKNLSSWVQRAGRVARARGSTGMAVMLVEKSAFEVAASEFPTADAANGEGTAQGRGRGRGATRARGRGRGRGRGGGMAKRGKDYAVSHGQKRGSYRGLDDAKPRTSMSEETTDIPWDAPGEGLYAFIQATICRRLVLTNILKNSKPEVPPLQCCDICNPKLFNYTRPGKPVRATRQKGIRRGPAVDSVREALFLWRRNMKKMHYPRALFAPHALLDDATCELLSSVGPIDSMDTLQQLLGSSWSLWEEFGARLYAYLHNLDIPPLPPPPPRQKASTGSTATPTTPAETPPAAPALQNPNKRVHPSENAPQDVPAPAAQRRRLQPPTPSTPSPAHSAPTPRARRPVPLPANAAGSRTSNSHAPASPHFQALSPHPRYLPSTPLRATAIPVPSTYPAPFLPQAYGRPSYYQPHPGMYATPPGHIYPYPYPYPGNFGSNSSPHPPAALANNPYASLMSPAYGAPASTPVAPVSQRVTALPPTPDSSMAPANTSSYPQSDLNTSFTGR
ncbi:P-loop containing nucleoside triphosphate hydrolase protein [Mycena vulgaris]|nr:P-loop containing nucleoside triphosphate hydrolase protein [Mycena vulgaris]